MNRSSRERLIWNRHRMLPNEFINYWPIHLLPLLLANDHFKTKVDKTKLEEIHMFLFLPPNAFICVHSYYTSSYFIETGNFSTFQRISSYVLYLNIFSLLDFASSLIHLQFLHLSLRWSLNLETCLSFPSILNISCLIFVIPSVYFHFCYCQYS